MELRLSDGTKIGDLTRPAQGMRHRLLFGVEESSGREVAAKIELIPGALEPERHALEWLTSQGGPSPRLLAVGEVDAPEEYSGSVCLVTDRVAGEPPTTAEGWVRMGRALARLAEVPWRGCGLDVQDHHSFLSIHEARLDDLGEALGDDLRGKLPQAPTSYPMSPLVLTHGDPGPGNYLDDGGAGTIIDWEDALVAPRGLDLGRAAFIALLGAGPEGYEAAEGTRRARAVVTGLLAEAEDWSPPPEELAWWLGVAGVQFAHRRLERAGQPGVLPGPTRSRY